MSTQDTPAPPSNSGRDSIKTPVPRALRFWTFVLASLLTFLLIWLLGFVLNDIGRIDGPDYQEIRSEHVDEALDERRAKLTKEISGIKEQVTRQSEIQKNLKRSMDNARDTMQQMMSLHRLSLEKQSPPSETEKEALANSQKLFLDAQNRYEEANSKIASANALRHEKDVELKESNLTLQKQEEPAREAYEKARRKHAFQLACFKLAFLLPLFALVIWLFLKWRRTGYAMLATSALVATFWKVGTVIFDHFPREFFKYIAIISAIIATVVFLVWLLRKIVRPNRAFLLDRYREGYRSHTCPVCAYPIARGPLRYARWTRKGPVLLAEGGNDKTDAEEECYACPSCGTSLFEPCGHCEQITPALLPFCDHCAEPTTESAKLKESVQENDQ